MLVYGNCDCFVMQMLYFCVLCASVAVLNVALCMTWLQFVDAARGWKRYNAEPVS